MSDLRIDIDAGYFEDDEEEDDELPLIPANGRHVTDKMVDEALDDEA